jgi:hypothetical protein
MILITKIIGEFKVNEPTLEEVFTSISIMNSKEPMFKTAPFCNLLAYIT